MCTLPVIIAALLTKKPEGAEPDWGGFFDMLSVSFSAPEQFVYAAAFLPPVIYLLYERYQEAEMEPGISDRIKLSFRKVFAGYGVVLVFACLALLITIITYTGTKTNVADLKNTYFYQLAVSIAPWCYVFSLYCWYLSILDGIPGSSNFLNDNEQAEKDFIGQFSDRIKTRAVK